MLYSKVTHFIIGSCRCLTMLLVLGVVLSSNSYAETSKQERTKLLKKFDGGQDAMIPVIVQFDRVDRTNPNALSKRRNFLTKREKFARNTKLKKNRNLKMFRYLPQAAMTVDREELNELLEDQNLRVIEDKLRRPLLAQSTSAVYSSKQISPYHGNNQWAVAILDTGVNKNHPFLSGKVVSEACYSDGGGQPSTVSLCPGGVTSSTALNSGLHCAVAGCSHGTQAAGIAAGNGSAFDGVARDAKLISIQVYSRINDESFCFPAASCVGAYTSDIIAGLERVYALRNSFSIASVNVSLGSDELFSGSCDDQPEKAAIDLLRTANIAVVAATGNAGSTSQMQAPACISSAISVAATFDNADVPWINNNISNQLDLFAPGVNITSSSSNGGFIADTGTSLAAPHVAGAWAVMRHASPSLSVAAIKNYFMGNGPNVTQNTVTRKRLDLRASLEKVRPGSQTNITGDVAEKLIPGVVLLLLEND